MKNAAAEKKYREDRKVQEAAKVQAREKRKQEETELFADVLGQPSKKAKQTTPLNVMTLSGFYEIFAPEVSDGWDCGGPLTLELAPSSKASHLWGSFNFGVIEGTLRSCSSLAPTNNKIKFLWRGRETGEGESTFGSESVAEFTFLDDGKLKGSMYWDCLGNFDLVGKRDGERSRGINYDLKVDDWKSNFRGLNERNYERERVGRWGGGFGGYEDQEGREPDSDTSNDDQSVDYEDFDENGYGVGLI